MSSPATSYGYGIDPLAYLRSGNKDSSWNKILGFFDPLSAMGGQDYSEMFNQINAGYDQSMQQIQAKIQAAEAQGRTDIADSLKRSLALNQPYMQAGNTALSAYLNSLGIGDQGAKGQQNLRNMFMEGPGFQYAVKTAQDVAQRRANATGLGMSGAEQREISSQAEGQASQGWDNWLSNYQKGLSDIAGIGQRSSMQQAGFETQGGNWLANLGLNYTNLDINSIMAAAKAKAEASMAGMSASAQQSNSWLSALGGIGGGILSFL